MSGQVTVRMVEDEAGVITLVVNDSGNRRDVEMEVAANVYRVLEAITKAMNPNAIFNIKGVTFVDDPEDAK